MKIVIHLITCFCVVLTVFANDTISSELAMELIKNQYINAKNCVFYITPIDSIYDDGDGSCIIDSFPQQDWLTSHTTPKWLIFVDEDPLKGWSHPCAYYYIPQHYSFMDETNIPIVKFNGRKFPRHIEMDRNSDVANYSQNSFNIFKPHEDEFITFSSCCFIMLERHRGAGARI